MPDGGLIRRRRGGSLSRRTPIMMRWTPPADGIEVPAWKLCDDHESGRRPDADYHHRSRHRQDGLFAKDKFCLIRRGRLVLAQRRARSGSDRALPGAGAAILRGSCPLGAGHEAAAVDSPPAAGRPSGGAAAVGQGLSAASAGPCRPARTPGHSAGGRRGGPSCT